MKGLLHPFFLIFCVSLLLLFDANAQYDNVWAFGYNAGVDFNKEPPEPIITSIDTRESSAVVCDSTGALLFYTDGDTVWDRDDNPMPNGTNLTGVGNITASSSQGTLILPVLGNDFQFYVFSLGSYDSESMLGRLSYSIVDMNQNNGMGDVLPEQKAILIDTIYTEHMSALPGYNCDIWLMVVDRYKNEFHAFSIDFDGINKKPVVSNKISTTESFYRGYIGSIDFSPDRSKMIIVHGSMVLYDFDAYTGVLSNPIILDSDENGYYGAAFSPDGSKVYGGSLLSVFQFDLSVGNEDTMIASKTLVGSAIWPAIKRAPDDKIYIAAYLTPFVHIIEKPNEKGTACQFILNGFELLPGTESSLGLPNMIPDVNLQTLRSKFSLLPGLNDSGCAPYTVELLNNSGWAKSYYWDFGDGRTSTERNPPPYTYDTPGVYRVMLAIFDERVCEGYDTFYMTISVFSVELPDIVVSDTLLCSYEESIGLRASVSNPSIFNRFEWTAPGDSAILSPANLPDIRVDPSKSNVFYITVWNSVSGICNMSSMDSVKIDYAPRVLAIHNSDTVVCEGTVIQINATGTEGHTYRWTSSAGVSDTTILEPTIDISHFESIRYMLTSSYPGCPDTSVFYKVDMHRIPYVDLGADKFVCYDDLVTLEPVIQPYRDDYIYEWRPVTGLTYTDRANSFFTADTTITYYLKVSTPIGCSTTDSIHILVSPSHFAEAISDTGYCPPGSIRLWARGGSNYLWTPGYGLDTPGISSPHANPQTPTDYRVYVTNEAGCVDSVDVFVDVYSRAVLQMPDSVKIYPGEQYHLESSTNAFYFDWFPPSGISDISVSDPWFFPEVRTRYFVTARTEQGCELLDSIDILVEETVLDLPNAFMPGGENGTFKVIKRGIVNLNYFTIYNRWGAKIFETTDVESGWDGTFNGTPQPMGVYIYSVSAKTVEGRTVDLKGNVTLIR